MGNVAKSAGSTPRITPDGTEVITVQQNPTRSGPIKSVTLQSIADLAVLGTVVTPNELGVNVYNGTGGTLAAGTLVYAIGYDATSGYISVAKADAGGALPASYVLRAAILDTATGTAHRTYTLTGVDTSAASAVGSPVYLSDTAGGWTLSAPTGASNVQIVGQVSIDAVAGAIAFDLQSQATSIWGTDSLQGTTSATAGTDVAEARSGQTVCSAPIVQSANAAACTIVTDVLAANGAQTIAAQPGTPRKLLLFITDANASISAGTLDIVGVDPSGTARTESIALTGGTASKTSTWAYATLTSATVTGLAGQGAGDNIALGVSNALGLVGCKTPASSAFAVFKVVVDGANDVVGTVDATAGTLTPTTAPNGSRVFLIFCTFAVTTTQNTHTHTL